MPKVSIDVPPEQRDALLRELLGTYATKAEAVHFAVTEYLAGEASADALLLHRRELAALDAMLRQLGWRLYVPRPETRLTAEPHHLVEVVHGALEVALSAVAGSQGERGDDPQAVARGIEGLRGLIATLDAIYR